MTYTRFIFSFWKDELLWGRCQKERTHATHPHSTCKADRLTFNLLYIFDSNFFFLFVEKIVKCLITTYFWNILLNPLAISFRLAFYFAELYFAKSLQFIFNRSYINMSFVAADILPPTHFTCVLLFNFVFYLAQAKVTFLSTILNVSKNFIFFHVFLCDPFLLRWRRKLLSRTENQPGINTIWNFIGEKKRTDEKLD